VLSAMMRLGLFLNFEHGEGEMSLSAFHRTIDLAVQAENVGLDELWVSEHHFTAFTQSGSILPLMAHLAGRTSRIRIGSAAILIPLHDPVRVAEDLATIDILSRGRLDLGLARGGPFPSQYAHFHVAPETAREQAAEATDFLMRLLTEREVSFRGRWYKSEDLTIFPRLVQEKLPVWIASTTKNAVVAAAARGHGLMAGHAATLAEIEARRAEYRAAGDGCEPDFVVLRTACVADTDAEALRLARPAMERFFGEMRRHANPGAPAGPVSLDKALSTAIIGSPETCRRKLEELAVVVPRGSTVLKLACADPSMAGEVVTRFRREILPAASAGERGGGSQAPVSAPRLLDLAAATGETS
jgi:alkanesulfonate monooxygenase SsuD/methylene tetrahydromethanopterin reductase-like flavin-dependent oxidoreductase (luciferase family)